MPWDLTEEFEYYINPPPPAKVHFGSGLPREACPYAGKLQSSFMRRFQNEVNEDTESTTHHHENKMIEYEQSHRVTSSKGTFSRDIFKPPVKKPNEHTEVAEAEPAKLKANCFPFNQGEPREFVYSRRGFKHDIIPASHSRFECTERFYHSFGGPKVMKCSIETKCVPFNLDECSKCKMLCTEQGEYWHSRHSVFLCRRDYVEMYCSKDSQYKGYLLREFQPIRDCSFMHDHQGSGKHYKKIMSVKDARHKFKVESHLHDYIPYRRNLHLAGNCVGSNRIEED